MAVLDKRLTLYRYKMSLKNNILIVEDEHINRELLKIFLEPSYELTFAEDLNTAIQSVDAQKFDLIITDIRLGNRLDGIELLEYAHTKGSNVTTPIVAYTSSDTSINQKSYAEEGFDGFLSKPATKDDILIKVADWISK